MFNFFNSLSEFKIVLCFLVLGCYLLIFQILVFYWLICKWVNKKRGKINKNMLFDKPYVCALMALPIIILGGYFLYWASV